MKLSSIAVTLSFLSMAEGRGIRSIHHQVSAAQPSYEVGIDLPNRILRGEEPPVDGSLRHKQITDKISGLTSTLDERELKKKKKKTTTKKVCCHPVSYAYRCRPLQLTHMICLPPLSLYLSSEKEETGMFIPS